MKTNPSLHWCTARTRSHRFVWDLTTLMFVLATSRYVAAQGALSVDPAFNPSLPAMGPSGSTRVIAVQPDGKILLGGDFNSVDGQSYSSVLRLTAAGGVEGTATFNTGIGVPGQYSNVVSMAVQGDGKILLGGFFTVINGQPRNRIARLNMDGTLESTATFNPGSGVTSGLVHSVVVQADGRILLGGSFSSVDGQPRNNIARLNADGTVESTVTFHPGSGPDAGVDTVALQADGKIVFAGSFSNVNGQPRHRIARLAADGTLDAIFNPDIGQDSHVNCSAVQEDGKIILGGSFITGIDPSFRLYGILRIDSSGVQKTLNLPLTSGYVGSIAPQTDGKILVGGSFETETLQRGIARLTPPLYNVESIATLDINQSIVAVQADGKILLGGPFTRVNGQTHIGIVRLLDAPASQSLSIVDSSKVQWVRGGSAPFVGQVTFERSTNNGASWTLLGPGGRVPGGWQLSGLNLPANAAIRARGRTTGGENNASSGIVEQTINLPEIAVIDSSGVDLVDGIAITNYGPVVTGSSSSKQFTIRNPGTVDLNGLAVTLAATGNPGDFIIGPFGTTTLAPGSELTFTVSFSPTAAGSRTATLQIASNDPDENPFEINLSGTQATPSEAWRQAYFGSPYNTGAGWDLNDPDRDGVVNLLEYATATDPLVPAPFPGNLVKNGSVLEFTYARRKAAVGEMSFVREFSETLTGTWSQVGGTVETILSDDGVLQQVKTTVPAGSIGKRFVRLRVRRI